MWVPILVYNSSYSQMECVLAGSSNNLDLLFVVTLSVMWKIGVDSSLCFGEAGNKMVRDRCSLSCCQLFLKKEAQDVLYVQTSGRCFFGWQWGATRWQIVQQYKWKHGPIQCWLNTKQLKISEMRFDSIMQASQVLEVLIWCNICSTQQCLHVLWDDQTCCKTFSARSQLPPYSLQHTEWVQISHQKL